MRQRRVDAIGKWIRAEVGDADAKPILATIVTDAHLRFYENMQHKVAYRVQPASRSSIASRRIPRQSPATRK